MPSFPYANLSVSRYEYAIQAVRRLNTRLPSNVLFDIGAGDGRLKGEIEAAGMHWHGFDLKPAIPEITKWDLSTPCPVSGRRAACVLLLDVIEHLTNPGLALSHIHEILQPSGRLVLTAPNPRWSRSRIHTLLFGTPLCFTRSDLDLNNHVFTPWPHILLWMLEQAGFDVEDYVTLDGKTGWPGTPISVRYPIRCVHALTNMLIELIDSSACGMSYGLIARALK